MKCSFFRTILAFLKMGFLLAVFWLLSQQLALSPRVDAQTQRIKQFIGGGTPTITLAEAWRGFVQLNTTINRNEVVGAKSVREVIESLQTACDKKKVGMRILLDGDAIDRKTQDLSVKLTTLPPKMSVVRLLKEVFAQANHKNVMLIVRPECVEITTQGSEDDVWCQIWWWMWIGFGDKLGIQLPTK
jgi:hypothetical protein